MPKRTFDVRNAQPILTDRLILQPLQISDAAEMHLVLKDAALYAFTGGRPLQLDELQERYTKLEIGSGGKSEVWVNLIVRLASSGVAIGYVQATIYTEEIPRADIAWVVGVSWQREGYASEAAQALVTWLQTQGVGRIRANIYPGHQASAGVAQRLGMHPTEILVDGETQWELSAAL